MDYFCSRAAEEKAAATRAWSPEAAELHLQLAERFERLALLAAQLPEAFAANDSGLPDDPGAP